MPINKEMRRLDSKWKSNSGWPKRIEWIELNGLRGWNGQRIDFKFPIVAVVGENGAGKSTVLQAAASIYRHDPSGQRPHFRYASDFFPDTPWDKMDGAKISFSIREGDSSISESIRKPTTRWRGNPERRIRHVEYIDLSRLLPVAARTGYLKIAKPKHTESSATIFEQSRLDRLSQIMGRKYDAAKMSLTTADARRSVPVVSHESHPYSGFHQGAGETMITELLRVDPPSYSLVIIDEIETSLHPRAQRRLMWDLAALCRDKEWQVIVSTHSPYILDELPLEARIYIMQSRDIVTGVSPDFAMTQMDEEQHPDCDIYVEDEKAAELVKATLYFHAKELHPRCRTISYGAASVGQALGIMSSQHRFPRPSCVFLDGDQAEATGCILLPGGDAPERVVFEALSVKEWANISTRIGRGAAEVSDACNRSMTLANHHDWINSAGNNLYLGGNILWQALVSEWVAQCLSVEDARKVTQPITDALLPQ